MGMVLPLCLIAALLAPVRGWAEVFVYPALSGEAGLEVVIYSSLDERLAQPLIAGVQAAEPGLTVRYEDLLTGEIYDRIVAETDAGQPTADFAISSAMDLQVKLANDGYAQAVDVPLRASWPDWANWRDTAYALTFEPAVFVYHKPAFGGGEPPSTRAELLAYLRAQPAGTGRIGTYDIERAGVGYLFLARDQEHFPDIWDLVAAMGAAAVQTFPTSQEILERVSDGRLMLGYNILGSYAQDWARSHPDVGVILPRDYTVVVSRIGLVPKAAARADLGALVLGYVMSAEGQRILSQQMQLAAVNPAVTGENSARAMQAQYGAQLRPVPVSPGVLVYLDRSKRARLIGRWHRALDGTAGGAGEP